MNLILAVVVLLFAVTPASAEWIGEVYGGFAKTGNNTLKETSSLGLTAKFHDVNFDASGTFGARGGYWFNELGGIAAYGMGLDVFHFGADIDQQSVPVQVGGLGTTATLQPLEVSVIGVRLDIVKVRLHLSKSEQFPNGQLQPYVTAGPAIFHSRLKDSNNVMPNNQRESDTSLGVKIGLGLQYLIGPNVGLFGEYRFTHFKVRAPSKTRLFLPLPKPCPRISIRITSLAGSRSTFNQCWGRAELGSIAKTLMHDRLGAKQAISASIG